MLSHAEYMETKFPQVLARKLQGRHMAATPKRGAHTVKCLTGWGELIYSWDSPRHRVVIEVRTRGYLTATGGVPPAGHHPHALVTLPLRGPRMPIRQVYTCLYHSDWKRRKERPAHACTRTVEANLKSCNNVLHSAWHRAHARPKYLEQICADSYSLCPSLGSALDDLRSIT